MRLPDYANDGSRDSDFIVDNFLFGDGGDELSDDDSFFEKGIIDSTGILYLIDFLEKTYNITIQDRDLVPDNLGSVNRVVDFTSRKLLQQDMEPPTTAT